MFFFKNHSGSFKNDALEGCFFSTMAILGIDLV